MQHKTQNQIRLQQGAIYGLGAFFILQLGEINFAELRSVICRCNGAMNETVLWGNKIYSLIQLSAALQAFSLWI